MQPPPEWAPFHSSASSHNANNAIRPPRRDWRDWFIMATVTTGVGYGLYAVAQVRYCHLPHHFSPQTKTNPQRYILPLISPPTPPQLEQDKAHIDESFNKAFAFIDQLNTDTAELKASETERTEKLDTTIKDVDTVIADLKAANTRREAESRIVADQVAGLKELVPKSLEQWKQNGDARLDELGLELQSLKKLLENRVGGRSMGGTPEPRMPTYVPPPKTNGVPSTPSTESAAPESAVPTSGMTVPKRDSSSPKRGGGGRAAIPAWQMAAAAAAANKNTSAPSSTNGEGSAEGGA